MAKADPNKIQEGIKEEPENVPQIIKYIRRERDEFIAPTNRDDMLTEFFKKCTKGQTILKIDFEQGPAHFGVYMGHDKGSITTYTGAIELRSALHNVRGLKIIEPNNIVAALNHVAGLG